MIRNERQSLQSDMAGSDSGGKLTIPSSTEGIAILNCRRFQVRVSGLLPIRLIMSLSV